MRKNDLENFKKLLKEKRSQILQNILNSNKEIEELRQNSGAIDEFDIASMISSEFGESIFMQQKKELNDIDLAIAKIDNGEYGICEMCDEEIAIARLKVNPHTKFCISCKEISEKNS